MTDNNYLMIHARIHALHTLFRLRSKPSGTDNKMMKLSFKLIPYYLHLKLQHILTITSANYRRIYTKNDTQIYNNELTDNNRSIIEYMLHLRFP